MNYNVNKAIIYTRVSSENQSDLDSTSLDSQLFVCEEYVKSKGFELLDTFEEVCSASDMNKMTELKKAIRTLKNYDDDCNLYLIVYDFSRFTRNSAQALKILEDLKKMDISVISVSQRELNSSSSDPNERFEVRSAISLAEYERDNMIKRLNESIEFRKNRGDVFGNPPFGQKSGRTPEGIRIFVDDYDEIYIINKIVELNDSGVYCENIASLMNDFKLPKRGIPWTVDMVESLIRRENDKM